MATVAEQLRREILERSRRLSPAERLAEALSLGRAAVATHAQAHSLSADEARHRLEQASQAGRRSSRVMHEIIR